MNFEKLFLYKQWSDQRLFKAIDQIDQVQYLEDYNFAKQQFNHMIIVEELFRSRLENKKALHSQTNTEFLPAIDEIKHRIAASHLWFIEFVQNIQSDQLAEIIHFQFIDKKTGTLVYVSVDGVYAGCIIISDIIKPTSAKAVKDLKKAGVKKVVMLTGDSKKVADAVGKQIGVDVVKSELLPADKVFEVEKLLDEKEKNEVLAFVGDGINDAPVLSRADIGIAMGALGSDAAIEAADIVLMDDDPSKIATAMNISAKTLKIVHQNIVFALMVKFICLFLGAIGIANMWIAIFADVGVMVLAVLNATRCLVYKD